MKKLVFTTVTLLFSAIMFAQETETEAPQKEGWTKDGNVSFQFNQAAFNDYWSGGGTSNIAGTLAGSYNFNYLKGDWSWNNRIGARYGMTKNDGDDAVKTDDLFEINSLLGKKASGYWSYSVFANFKTQFDYGRIDMDSYTYNPNTDGVLSTDDFLAVDGETVSVQNSHGFSPWFLKFGPGMLWKRHENLYFNIAPATSKIIHVHDEFTEIDENDLSSVENATLAYNILNSGAFGVERGDTFRYEFGAAIDGYYKFDIMENISMENIVSLYSNYLEDPQNIDIDYTMNVVMTINKYLSTNFSFQAIYDDNTVGRFQIREGFGLGVNYKL